MAPSGFQPASQLSTPSVILSDRHGPGAGGLTQQGLQQMHFPFVCVCVSPPRERPGRETGRSLGFSSELTCSGCLLGLCREGLSSRAGQGVSGLWAWVSWRRGYPEANLAIDLGG